MRFMAMSNFFFGGALHEASPTAPKIFDFPKDEVPSAQWRPLDPEARKALEALRDRTKAGDDGKGNGNIIRIFDIPPEFDGAALKGEKIDKPERTNPDKLPDETLAAVAPKGAAVAKVVAKGGRPSDQEPT